MSRGFGTVKQAWLSTLFLFALGLGAAQAAIGANVDKAVPNQRPKLTEVKSRAALPGGYRRFTFVLPGVVIRGPMSELRVGDDGLPSYVFRLKKGQLTLFMPSKGKRSSHVVMPPGAHVDPEFRKL